MDGDGVHGEMVKKTQTDRRRPRDLGVIDYEVQRVTTSGCHPIFYSPCRAVLEVGVTKTFMMSSSACCLFSIRHPSHGV